jgi:dihydropteroate synthase
MKKVAIKGRRAFEFNMPAIMGVLNITPDSFSDGGKYFNWGAALSRSRELIDEGADIIDIGGESSRPGSDPVSAEDELQRVIPMVKSIRQFSQVAVSVDTAKAEVARQALEAGADIINDISALRFDREMASVIKEYKAPVVLMHMLGEPKTMQDAPNYENCLAEIKLFFEERIEFCERNGIARQGIIIDPGIGFGKRLQDNVAILRHLDEFRSLGCFLMLGTSRKSFIGNITGIKDHPEKRIGGSIASALLGIEKGVDILRVHDVAPTVEAVKVFKTITEAE